MVHSVIPVLICLCLIVWAISASRERRRTLLWMVGSWVVGWIAFATLIVWEYGARENIAVAIADLYTIPSLAVPAAVGVIHGRRTRSSRNP